MFIYEQTLSQSAHYHCLQGKRYDMNFLKRMFFFLLWLLQVHHFCRYVHRRKVVVLAYHGVVDDDDGGLWTLLPARRFREQIEYLNKYYSVISIDMLADFVEGKATIPDNSVVITFDDGYRNNHDIAFPVLLEYKTPATIFVTSGIIDRQELSWFDEIAVSLETYKGKLELPPLEMAVSVTDTNRQIVTEMLIQRTKRLCPDLRSTVLSVVRDLPASGEAKRHRMKENLMPLNWNQVRTLNASPLITIGAHTSDHTILTTCSLEYAREQILESKRSIERNINEHVDYFAYPNGTHRDFDEDIQNCLKGHDFRLACTTIKKFVDKGTNPLEVGRFCVGNDLTSWLPYFSLNLSGFSRIPSCRKRVAV